MMPVLFFNGMSQNWGSVLNARERFALAALAPIATPLLPLCTLLLLPRLGVTVGIELFAVANACGFFIEAAIIGYGLHAHDLPVVPRWSGGGAALRGVCAQYLPMMVGQLLMGSMVMVDQYIAVRLPAGSNAALGYGNKVPTLFLSIGTMALGSAVLPYFSQLVAREDWAGVKHTLRFYGAMVLAITVPLTAVLVATSAPLVRLLFQGGAFRPEDVTAVASVQRMYLLQLPVYFLCSLAARLMFSLRGNHLLSLLYFVALVAKIVAVAVLAPRMGVAGVALSTTLVYALAVVLYAIVGRYLWAVRRAERASGQRLAS
jgi:putative peptidoglycan lipid II flippase